VGSRSLWRRLRDQAARFDPLDVFLFWLGMVFFTVAGLCGFATIVLIMHFRDVESGFPAGEGFIKGMKGFGLVFFPVLGLVAFLVAWNMAGERIVRFVKERRRGRG
jgi:hypothetical protein